MIKPIQDIEITVSYVCPNTGNKVTLETKDYVSPINVRVDSGGYSEYTTWEDIYIDTIECPECGLEHEYSV